MKETFNLAYLGLFLLGKSPSGKGMGVKMHRIMIIDDEKSHRNLLKRIVDWKELDAEVVGEASSGIEAINEIDDLEPDIALVDIRMPFMDGLEFAKHMTKQYPALRMIILSAHQDFEYARQCMRLGISQYLLKPIAKEEVMEALKREISALPPKNRENQPGNEKIHLNQYIRYIEDNYQNPKINLTYVANEYGFHPVYFSRKFKEKTGMTFTDYLMRYRIKKACGQAKEGQLMYIAAEQVGIPDSVYFGKCFKKYMGMSYSDYRKRNGSSA